jgi:cellulase/cellobiase CelA1
VERAYALRAGTPPPSTCKVTYVPNSWGTGFTASVDITNTGTTTINGWTLAWRFTGNQQITSTWNAVPTQNGQQVSMANTSHNGTIAPAGKASFGFQGTYSGTNATPDSFTLNGAPCTT